jgi:hypothetical protein
MQTAGEFDYPYPLDQAQEAEAERLTAERERGRRLAEVKLWALLCVRALGRDGEKPEWGGTVRQAVLQAFRQSLPIGSTPMDLDRFEEALRQVAADRGASARAAGVLLDNAPQLSALEHGMKIVQAARGKAVR